MTLGVCLYGTWGGGAAHRSPAAAADAPGPPAPAQRADWRTHKASCKLLRAKQDYEENLASGEYVGTLRWGKDTKFPELPPRGRLLAPLAGWEVRRRSACGACGV